MSEHRPGIGLSSAGRHTFCLECGEPWPCRSIVVARASVPSGALPSVEALASVLHDAIPCKWQPHAGWIAETDRAYHEAQARHILKALARLSRSPEGSPDE